MTLPTTNLIQGINSQPGVAVFAFGPDDKTELLSDSSAIVPGYPVKYVSGKLQALAQDDVILFGVAAENSFQGVESYLTAFATSGDKAQVPVYFRPGLGFYGVIDYTVATALVPGDLLMIGSTAGKLTKRTGTHISVARYLGPAFTPGTADTRGLCMLLSAVA